MKRALTAIAVCLMLAGASGALIVRAFAAAAVQGRPSTAREVPKFKVDPAWPKIPSKWILGIVSSSNVDAQDNVWVLHRPLTLAADEKSKTAPPVLEFNAAGDFLQAWGGPGDGYEWPNT